MDRPEGHPDINDRWLVATRTVDREGRDTELPDQLKGYGIDIDVLEFVAEQRAIRAVLAGSPRAAAIRKKAEAVEAGEPGADEGMAVEMNPQEKASVTFLAAVYMEALVIGWRAHQIKPGDYPDIAPPPPK